MFLISLPAIETVTKIIPVDGLKGAFFRKEKPQFSYKDWFEGSFQPKYEEYLNDTIGLRNFFIRTRNQVDYTLFNTLHTYDIVIDKKGHLNATTHYDFHLGKPTLNTTSIDSNCIKLQKIKTEFAKMNKQIIILLAPCKGWFGLNDAPYWYNKNKTGESYYERYLIKLKDYQIDFIDFNAHYNLGSFSYKPFTDYGIHWSKPAAFWAFDSISKFIEQKRNIDIPNIIFNGYDSTDTPAHPDADLADALNLFQSYPIKGKFYYPKFSMESEINKTKPSPIFISDSFYWNTIYDGFLEKQYNFLSFWYYNKTAYISGEANSKNVSDLNLSFEINKHDVFFILSTEINLPELGWGFINNVYNNLEEIKALHAVKEKIKADSQWMQQIEEKAKKGGISQDLQLLMDAVYIKGLEK